MRVRELFAQGARDYDRARRQLVPCFDDFYGTAVELIPYPRNAAIAVLDLGAGTGLVSSFVAAAFPNATLTLLDVSEEMLAIARKRFTAAADRFHFEVRDYTATPLSGAYHAVVSGLSIHHLTDQGKRDLFTAVYRVVRPGGVFVNADQVLGATPEIEATYRERWESHARARGISEADLAAALERMKEDKMAPLDAQLAWLRAARFAKVDCWFKSYSFVVYSGTKAVPQATARQRR